MKLFTAKLWSNWKKNQCFQSTWAYIHSCIQFSHITFWIRCEIVYLLYENNDNTIESAHETPCKMKQVDAVCCIAKLMRFVVCIHLFVCDNTKKIHNLIINSKHYTTVLYASNCVYVLNSTGSILTVGSIFFQYDLSLVVNNIK